MLFWNWFGSTIDNEVQEQLRLLGKNITALNETIKESNENLIDFDTQLIEENKNIETKYNKTKGELETLKKKQENLNSQLKTSENIYKDIYENGK